MLPECLLPDYQRGFDHPHPSLNAEELRNVFEKFDFSRLIFRQEDQLDILEDLIYLFEWLINHVSLELLEYCLFITQSKQMTSELLQSNMVEKISIGELNLACVPEAKFSYEAEWFRSKEGTLVCSSGSPKIYSAISVQVGLT